MVHDVRVQPDVWERIDASAWIIRSVEQAGSSRNLWLEEPDSDRQWLHKDTVVPDNGIEQGEDWSEVVSTQVAVLLGVPCAATRLCSRDGRRGSLSLSVRPADHALWEGNVVLEQAAVLGYYPHTEGRPGRDPSRPGVQRPGHTLQNVRLALETVIPPTAPEGLGGLTGYDVFAGFMVFDALIANQDRHEQNWAILAPLLTTAPQRVSPSYDHAGSLGYNLTDAHRQRCLTTDGGLQRWASKGAARRFEHLGRPPSLVEQAASAVALCSRDGANRWRLQLGSLDLTPLRASLSRADIDGMSDLAVTFVMELLDLNLRRLRDAIC